MVNKASYLKQTLKGFLGLVVIYLAYTAINSNASYKRKPSQTYKPTESELQQAVNGINKDSYTWKDSVTEFLNAVVLSDSELQYNFALKIDATKYDMKKLKELNEKNLSKNFDDTIAKAFFKNNNITVSYNYTDTAMHPLYKIIFTPDKFK